MDKLFGVEGEDLDLGYRSLRAGASAIEREIVEARFWEMLIGCALLDAGKTLRRFTTATRRATGYLRSRE